MKQSKGFIVVAGNIGVGKSSFVQIFSQYYREFKPVFEVVEENPYLADFYADMPRWAFPSQVFFLTRRIRQHAESMQLISDVIHDRCIYEDAEIFARNLAQQGILSPREWSTYQDLYQAITASLPPPTIVLYLRASVPVLQARIAKRGRHYEQAIPTTYLDGLNKLYERWATAFTLAPVVTIDTDALDFVANAADFAYIAQKLKKGS